MCILCLGSMRLYAGDTDGPENGMDGLTRES